MYYVLSGEEFEETPPPTFKQLARGQNLILTLLH